MVSIWNFDFITFFIIFSIFNFKYKVLINLKSIGEVRSKKVLRKYEKKFSISFSINSNNF